MFNTKETDQLLKIDRLKKYFQVGNGQLHAVDDVSFTIDRGKTLGVVGESGCGKSTLGRVILRLHEPTDGNVYFEEKDVFASNRKEMKALRRDMQIIFQDPFSSLNPRMTVSQAIIEPLLIQKKFSMRDKEGLMNKVHEVMDMVGLASQFVNTYPHELDGGRRQRIGIARALVLNPKFIVCDEPVSALDVSIQAQILNLMQDLQHELNLTYLFITHNLLVVKHFSDDIAVMYLGQIVEKAPAKKLFNNPIHPYTKALLSAIPISDPDIKTEPVLLQGELFSPIDPKPGCRFAARCICSIPECSMADIEMKESEPGHFHSCLRF